MRVSCGEIWRVRSTIIIIATPLLLLPLPCLYTTEAGRCAYGLIIMAVFWMTEAIPIAATALFPMVIFPWLGVASSKDLCKNYFKDTNVLFVGGLMVAVAVEKWNLHKRIALRVLLLVGSKPKWLMFGFMTTTAFLSMWISNTATTAMMVPIVQAVLTQLERHRRSARGVKVNGSDATDAIAESDVDKNTDGDMELISSNEPLQRHNDPPTYNTIYPESQCDADLEATDKFRQMCKGMTLCVCYAANIGGTATLTGTGPNLVLKGQVDTLYGPGTGITFSSWFIFAFPNMILALGLAWIWLQFMYLGPRQLFSCFYKVKVKHDSTANEVIRSEYKKLGLMSFAEKAVLTHFIILALLWLTREPEFVPGWSYFTKEGYVTDACVAITICIMLFLFPSRWPNYWCFRRASDTEPPGPAVGLLDWDTVHHNLPWGIVLVLGGGFALADACKISGLSADISELFISFRGIPPSALVFVLCVITATFTEVTSNVATTTIFLPILAEVATSMHVNPLYLMIPVTISASFAFMLPVATPPNAIVFAYGHLKVIDMVKAGIMMNVICIMLLQLAVNTWGYAYFKLGEYPAWAGNLTTHNDTNMYLTTPSMLLNNITV